MALAEQAASAQAGSLGSHSNAAVALPANNAASDSIDELAKAVKISRAMRAGPLEITRNATVAEMDPHGNMANILRPGTNGYARLASSFRASCADVSREIPAGLLVSAEMLRDGG
jgi:hypothetical protein